MATRPSAARVLVSVSLGVVGCSGRNGPRQVGEPAASSAPVVAASSTASHAGAVSYGTIASDAAPLSLTTEDGNGLALASLQAKVVIEGPLAFTELHLRFTNPDARVREGRFQIALPAGAAVNRFAMNVDGRWMEAEMVERSVARRAYEDFLHRRTDPALLEKQAGNQFAARVFPIPANADKELIVSYAQELGDGPYVLPLRGLPVIGQIEASARVLRADRAAAAWDETTLSERSWQPDRDFAVAAASRPQAVVSGDLVAARVVPELGVGAAPIHDATILVDDSASRALGWDHTVDDVAAMIAKLAATQGDPHITVAAFDQEIAPIYDGAASRFDAHAAAALRARGALGASDLGLALAWAKAHGAKDRVVVVTDGVATAGDTDLAALGKAVGALGPAAGRLDVVLAGGIRDEPTAKALARGHLAADGAVLDLAASPDEVARRLGLGTRSSAAVVVDGATWTWPDHLDGLQPGDGAVVYAQLGGKARGRAEVTVTVADHRVALAPVSVPRPLVERAAAEAQVQWMEAEAGKTTDAKARAAIAQKIVALSIAERVLSDYTALLVLETDADYARYGLDRKALADVLVVGADGLELHHRDAPAVIAAPAEPKIATTKSDAKDKEKYKPELAKQIEDVTADKPAQPEADRLRRADTDDLRLQLDDGGGDGDTNLPVAKKPEPARGAISGADESRTVEPKPAEQLELRPPPTVEPSAGQSPPPPAPPPPPPRPGHAPSTPSPSHRDVQVDGRVANGAEAIVADPAAADAEGAGDDDSDARDAAPPWDGDYKDVMTEIGAGRADAALARARAWHDKSPGDVLGLVALGDALEAKGDRAAAARAYGSIIDLFPARADLRRFAGERLERIADRDPSVSRALVLDTYRRAVDDRPDHLTGHRLYAYALVRAGRWADALAALERGLDQPYPPDRFRGGDRILREDLGIVGAAWAAAEPKRKAEIEARIAKRGARLDAGPTTRFILYWETDDNDVDFHIHDAHGGHAFYKHMHLRSGGDLYADVTTGYGPEEFTMGAATAGPYHLQIHYFARGPMGYGMGTLEILRRDAGGRLAFEHRPFIVMNDKAYVDLGVVK